MKPCRKRQYPRQHLPDGSRDVVLRCMGVRAKGRKEAVEKKTTSRESRFGEDTLWDLVPIVSISSKHSFVFYFGPDSLLG